MYFFKSQIILIFILLPISNIHATTYVSDKKGGGNWTNSSIWNPSGYPTLEEDNADIDNKDSIYISGSQVHISVLTIRNNSIVHISSDSKLTVDSIKVINNGKIYASGPLVVIGGISGENNTEFKIDGIATVGGNVDLGQNVVLEVNGHLTIDGKLEGGNGTIIAGSGTVTTGSCSGTFCTDSQLPINLEMFKVQFNNKNVHIVFSTLSEQNFDYFSIERSADAETYVSIGTVKGAGWSAEKKEYSFTDTNPLPGHNYYRLKAVDFDGKTEYFKAVCVFNDHAQAIVQTLVTDNSLMIRSNFAGEATLRSLTGSGVYALEIKRGSNEAILPAHLPKGMYALTISSGNKIVKREKVVIF